MNRSLVLYRRWACEQITENSHILCSKSIPDVTKRRALDENIILAYVLELDCNRDYHIKGEIEKMLFIYGRVQEDVYYLKHVLGSI